MLGPPERAICHPVRRVLQTTRVVPLLRLFEPRQRQQTAKCHPCPAASSTSGKREVGEADIGPAKSRQAVAGGCARRVEGLAERRASGRRDRRGARVHAAASSRVTNRLSG